MIYNPVLSLWSLNTYSLKMLIKCRKAFKWKIVRKEKSYD